eukprot:34947-Pelagomonas_calceolata.AAC.2
MVDTKTTLRCSEKGEAYNEETVSVQVQGNMNSNLSLPLTHLMCSRHHALARAPTTWQQRTCMVSIKEGTGVAGGSPLAQLMTINVTVHAVCCILRRRSATHIFPALHTACYDGSWLCVGQTSVHLQWYDMCTA